MIEPTGFPTIDSINSYLELFSDEQHQEVLNFTQILFIGMTIKKIKSLPPNKQCEVLDFIDYLIEKTKDQNSISESAINPLTQRCSK